MIRGYLALAGALVIGIGLFWAGNALWKAGYAACSAERSAAVERARAEAARVGEIASRKEAERLAAETERARVASELEDLANAGPVVVAECLSADRVQRLNSR
jgi:hypothetical protein